MAKKPEVTMEELYALRPRAIWRQFWSEHFSFWMICGYLFVEYVRPQAIIPSLDFLPWASVFLMLSLIGAVVDPTVKWVKAPANKWMILFFVVILLSSWSAYIPSVSYRMLDSFYTWLIIYFLIINIVNTPKRLFIFFGIFILASFKISLSLAIVWAKRGFAFSDWGLMGPAGFFQNSGELAIQMCVFFPIAYHFSIKLKPYVSQKIFLILMLMPITSALVVLGASSRGGQVALAAQMLIMFRRHIFKPKALIPIVLVGWGLFLLLPDEQKERFSNAGDDKTSQQRLNYWEGGIDMLNDHPILGVGYFNFPRYFESHYPSLMLYPHAQLPHNIFIQVGADLGYSGLLVYSLLILACFSRRQKGQQSDDRLLDGLPGVLNISVIGFFIAGQFVSVVYYPFMWVHLALRVCAVNAAWAETATAKAVNDQTEGNLSKRKPRS